MDNRCCKLVMIFDGAETDRRDFINKIRAQVTGFTKEQMKLDALIVEIGKNIFDHAGGLGLLTIEEKNGSFVFEIHDEGKQEYDFEFCWNNSRLAGNGINFGTGLRIIFSLAKTLAIDLNVDTRKGFSYSGIYTPSISSS